ncbi:hypothetical protein BN990_04109 [Virgibacillus salexigens]|uniref:DUF1433 domain-containing protein n=1 Tax=Virgibacillus massiliensis TaxID=1462526 RepID=A0A024QHJ4_9BACI|nr:hypothetical protein BN990_04109 [Virgibacillus massiliensis]
MFFIVTTIMLTGCNVSSSIETYDDTKATEAVKQYLKNNFEGIESVKVDDIYQSPMGGFTVDGNVNEGVADFSAGVENDYTLGSIGLSEGFPERKEECKEQSCK